MRALLSILTSVSLVLAPAAARSAEFTPEISNALDACIKAATERLPGYVTGWRIDWQSGGLAYGMEILTTNDRVWEMRCEGGAIVREKSTFGMGSYQELHARVMVPEKSAREAAVSAYPKGELQKMKYGRAWRGRVYYTYTFDLPDGREALVHVNSATGRIDETTSERKS